MHAHAITINQTGLCNTVLYIHDQTCGGGVRISLAGAVK